MNTSALSDAINAFKYPGIGDNDSYDITLKKIALGRVNPVVTIAGSFLASCECGSDLQLFLSNLANAPESYRPTALSLPGVRKEREVPVSKNQIDKISRNPAHYRSLQFMKAKELVGSITQGHASSKIPMDFSISSEDLTDSLSPIALVTNLANKLPINYLGVHIPLYEELVSLLEMGVASGVYHQEKGPYVPSLEISHHRISHGLPSVFWLTIYGAPYVEMLGRKLLFNAPVYKVYELPFGAIGHQMSEKIGDLLGETYDFIKHKNEIMDYLGRDVFGIAYKKSPLNVRLPKSYRIVACAGELK